MGTMIGIMDGLEVSRGEGHQPRILLMAHECSPVQGFRAFRWVEPGAAGGAAV